MWPLSIFLRLKEIILKTNMNITYILLRFIRNYPKNLSCGLGSGSAPFCVFDDVGEVEFWLYIYIYIYKKYFEINLTCSKLIFELILKVSVEF